MELKPEYRYYGTASQLPPHTLVLVGEEEEEKE
jgi:hypothetical protein